MKSGNLIGINRSWVGAIVLTALALVMFLGVQMGSCDTAYAAQAKPKITVQSGKTAKLKVGERHQVKVKVSKGAKTTFKSSKKSVASVSKKGVVKAKKAGKATITVKAKRGGKSAIKKIKVTVVGKTPSSGSDEAERAPEGVSPGEPPASDGDSGQQENEPSGPNNQGAGETPPEGDNVAGPQDTQEPETSSGNTETFTFTYPCRNVTPGGLFFQTLIYQPLPENADLETVGVVVHFPDGTSYTLITPGEGDVYELGTQGIYVNSSSSPITGHGNGMAEFVVTYQTIE